MHNPPPTRRLRQAGQVMVLFALGAIGLVAVAGLAIDGGNGYVDQRALQGAVDTASDAGARMLAADFSACATSKPLPYSNGEILAAIGAVLTKASAGNSALASSTAQYVSFPPLATSPIPIGNVASYSLAFCPSPPAWAGPQGVKVDAIDQHHTIFLQVVGIAHATEAATAISLFGPAGGGQYIPFVTYADLSCAGDSPTPVTPGSIVTYYDTPDWAQDYPSCPIPGPSSFKGFLKDETPNPIPVPGDITAQDGGAIGQWPFPIKKNQVLLLPLINCGPTGSQCSYNSPWYTLHAVGLIEIQALANCQNSSDAPCQGVVLPVVSGSTTGIIFCPQVPSTSCSSGLSSNLAEPIVVELWQ